MLDPAGLRAALDGDLLEPGLPAYDAVRRPEQRAFEDVRPLLVARCASDEDVVRSLSFARDAGIRVAPRGGGHCFAGRSSTEGLLLDLSGLADVAVQGERATIGAGARLGATYDLLHLAGRTLPAGCGETVGIAGLTLGGGIGLLGRQYGLTCDRLLEARVVLADGRVVTCDADTEPDLFWALRGAGGGQFGVVTSLTFATVPEPATTRFELGWSSASTFDVVAAWQQWSPGAPDELTATLTVVAQPGGPDHDVVLFGASTLEEGPTRGVLDEFCAVAGASVRDDVRPGLPYTELKRSFRDLDAAEDPGDAPLIRSEFFATPMRAGTLTSLLAAFEDRPPGEHRQLTFTAMGGAYRRVPADATAFAHRDADFLLEHNGVLSRPWVDSSWEIAHADGSGGVYTNFPDSGLLDWATAYHGANYPRLTRVKRAYDPDRFFDFPQCVEPA